MVKRPLLTVPKKNERGFFFYPLYHTLFTLFTLFTIPFSPLPLTLFTIKEGQRGLFFAPLSYLLLLPSLPLLTRVTLFTPNSLMVKRVTRESTVRRGKGNPKGSLFCPFTIPLTLTLFTPSNKGYPFYPKLLNGKEGDKGKYGKKG